MPWWGLAAFGTARDDRREARALRAEGAHAVLEGQGERRLGGLGVEQAVHVGQGLAGQRAGVLDAGHLPGVLGPPLGLDQPGGGDQGGRQRVPVAAVGGPAHVLGLEAEATEAADAVGQRVHLDGQGTPDGDAGLRAGRGQLLGGPLLVAAVGHQHQVVGQEERPAGRAGEAGQPAHVGQIRDEQRVDAGGRHAGPDPPGTRTDVERRQVPGRHRARRQVVGRGHDGPPISRASASIASS